MRRCNVYRKSFPMMEIALPAMALRNRGVAKWVGGHSLAVNMCTSEELTVAIAAGVHPSRLTVCADALGEAELRSAVNLGVGGVVVVRPSMSSCSDRLLCNEGRESSSG